MNQKEEFKKWLQLDSGDGKYVMEKLLDFYAITEDFFKREGINFKLSYEVSLIKFSWFFFIHSNSKTYKNPANHQNNTENDMLIEELYNEILDICSSAAFPFLYLQNNDTKFEFFEMIKELI